MNKKNKRTNKWTDKLNRVTNARYLIIILLSKCYLSQESKSRLNPSEERETHTQKKSGTIIVVKNVI